MVHAHRLRSATELEYVRKRHQTKTIESNLNEEIAHDETVVKPFNGDDKIEDTQRERHRLNRSAY